MRKKIGRKLEDYHNTIDEEFLDKYFHTENDEKIFRRKLPRGTHVGFEAYSLARATDKVKKNGKEDLYFWYKWLNYYKLKLIFYILFFTTIFRKILFGYTEE